MREIFKNLRVSNFPKNFLILFPLILSGNFDIEIHQNTILKSLFIFFIITSACYLINDFSDQKRDRENKLKKNPNLSKKKFLNYLISLVCILFTSLIFFDQSYNYFLYLYILNFFVYNYFGKNFKFLDILLLTNFYLIRILYGIQVFKLDVSIGFILFAFTLFLCLSAVKRLTQIKMNNLVKKNLVISYNADNTNSLRLIFNLTFFFNILISTLYYIYNLQNFNLKNNLFVYVNQIPIEKLTFLYSIYILIMLNFFVNVQKNKINKDIYLYFTYNKINLLLLMASIIILLY